MKKQRLNIRLTTLLSTVIVTIPLSANATTHTDKMIAVVNDTPILQSQFQQAAKLKMTKDQVLSTLISRELQLSLVKQYGIAPTDKEVNRQLLKYAKNKGLANIDELQKALDGKQAYSYAKLRQNVINNLSVELLKNRQVASKINLTAQEVDAYLASPEGIRLNQNEYQTVHIRVPFPASLEELTSQQLNDATAVAKKIESELRYTTDNSNKSIANIISKQQPNYPIKLQGGNMGFNKANSLPVTLADKIVNLSVNQVNTPITTKEGIDIIKLVDKRVSNDMLVPQWRTRHILIAVNDTQSSDLAKYKINGLYSQINQGADFAKLAATYSNDPGSAGKGGDLDWVSEGVMVQKFEQVMKQTAVGSVSQPFKTQFGWHIVQVVKTRNYDASNDVRRKMAREILYKRMAPQATQDWLDEIRSNAYVHVF